MNHPHSIQLDTPLENFWAMINTSTQTSYNTYFECLPKTTVKICQSLKKSEEYFFCAQGFEILTNKNGWPTISTSIINQSIARPDIVRLLDEKVHYTLYQHVFLACIPRQYRQLWNNAVS